MNSNSGEQERYYPSEEKSLSTAILAAIEEQKGRDLSMTDFQLYDDIDPDALDNLFQEDSTSNTTVRFDTDDVTVTLWGDGGVEIRVTPQSNDI